GSASGSTLDIVLTDQIYTKYNNLKFVLTRFIPSINDRELWLRFSSDGGSTYDTTTYSWVNQKSRDGNPDPPVGNGSTSDSKIIVGGSLTGGEAVSSTTAHGGVSVEIDLELFASSTYFPRVGYKGDWADSTPQMFQMTGAGYRENAQLTSAVRLLFETGNI